MENPLLAGIQAQWVRLHNEFARELAVIRPDWQNNDDLLYEETKKILSALHQRYVYDDWLPILIGKQTTQQYVGDTGLFSQYNPNVNIERKSSSSISDLFRSLVWYLMKLQQLLYVYIH
jgi:hypothetical protein